MEQRTKKIFITSTLLTALFAFTIIPASAGNLSHLSTTSGYSDPIAVGYWQYDQYDSIIVAQAQNYGMDPFVIKSVIMLESGFNTYAQSIVINSACGWTHDLGLMQVNAYCASINPPSVLFDPQTNIQYGTSQLSNAYRQLGDINLALQAYNIGLWSVQNGARNWAYSSNVMSYVQQFESEHANLYGSSGSSPAPSSQGNTYTVRPGDTLSLIASRYATSYQSIAQTNGISYPYLIYPGQTLTISSSSASSGSWSYTVSPGDTLIQIGAREGVPWESLAQANGISYPYLIYVGQTLTIP